MTGTLIIAVTIGLSLAMMLAWGLQRRLGNAGWVDAVWSFALGIAGVIYALAPALGVPWPAPRQLVVAALIAAWAVRLGLHLVARSRTGPEDARYAQFRRDWGSHFESRMFWFLQIQAAAAALLALSILLAARNPRPLGPLDAIGLLLIGIAVVGEAVADAQLGRFRSDPANHGKICETGLWCWSRHPNYFFEAFGWLGYPFLAMAPGGDYPLGWLAFSSPVFMYWLLAHVSGVPPLEAQMLRTRGDAYRAYQARTRPILPIPLPRKR